MKVIYHVFVRGIYDIKKVLDFILLHVTLFSDFDMELKTSS